MATGQGKSGTSSPKVPTYEWRTALGLLVAQGEFGMARQLLEANSEMADLLVNQNPCVLLQTVKGGVVCDPPPRSHGMGGTCRTARNSFPRPVPVISIRASTIWIPCSIVTEHVDFLQYLLRFEIDPNLADEDGLLLPLRVCGTSSPSDYGPDHCPSGRVMRMVVIMTRSQTI